jgi:hypothetical protein
VPAAFEKNPPLRIDQLSFARIDPEEGASNLSTSAMIGRACV